MLYGIIATFDTLISITRPYSDASGQPFPASPPRELRIDRRVRADLAEALSLQPLI